MHNKLSYISYLLGGAFILMMDAFYNGFPIVYSDTSTYLASGFELETPFDRPITYGLLLRLFSLNGFSLFLVIFFQALILSYLIFRLTQLFVSIKVFLNVGLAIILFLSAFTSLSLTVCQIMPDIFTTIALLTLSLILLGSYPKRTLLFLYVLYFVAIATHMSHVLIFAILLVIIFLFRKYFFAKNDCHDIKIKISILFILTLTSVVTMGSALAKSKHIFFMGAMVEHGIIKEFLQDNCNTKPYKFCAYKDSLPGKAYQFIWEENSPLYKMGGWKATRNEFNDIIFETFIQPKYLLMQCKESIKATFQQLLLYEIGEGNGRFGKGTVLFERVSRYFKNDISAYRTSKQNLSQTGFLKGFNLLFSIIILLSLILLIFILMRFQTSFDKRIITLSYIIFLGIFLNAWDCGTFANAIHRLGAKLIWLIPFCLILLGLQLYSKNHNYPEQLKLKPQKQN